MPVLGADPDAPPTKWEEHDEYVSRPRRARPGVYELTQYFAYHKDMKMSQRHDATCVGALNRLFARRLDQGYTKDSLQTMVDRFYQSWGADSEVPALTFSSNKVQDVLLREAEVVKDDPVLSWLLVGMPNNGPFDDPAEMRKAVLLYAGDLPQRYPDVVADILRMEASLTTTADRLTSVHELINFKLGHGGVLPDLDPALLQFLPPELLSPRGRNIRKAHDTMQQAIGAIPMTKTVTW